MADIIQIGSVSIYQDIELSLTERMVPPVVHVKQFDHKSRKMIRQIQAMMAVKKNPALSRRKEARNGKQYPGRAGQYLPGY